MKNIFLTTCSILFFVLQISAQANRGSGNSSPVKIYGKVVDAKNNKGLEAASVQLVIVSTGSSGTAKDSVIAGMFTRPNGDFSFDNIIVPDSLQVVISAIGYTLYRRPHYIQQQERGCGERSWQYFHSTGSEYAFQRNGYGIKALFANGHR